MSTFSQNSFNSHTFQALKEGLFKFFLPHGRQSWSRPLQKTNKKLKILLLMLGALAINYNSPRVNYET